MTPIAAAIAAGLLPGTIAALMSAACLPWLARESVPARTLVLAAALLLMWRYIVWRLVETLPPVALDLDFVVGVVFLAVETSSAVCATCSLVFLSRTRNRSPDVEANLAWLRNLDPIPPVDVLICTYNEEEAILARTISGALWTSYPNARIWVCDDGRRDWLEALCAARGVGYLTRADNAHAKAGNINSALKHLAALDEPPQFVAILDADFVPTPRFLERALTLFRDPLVAVVQTPQHFINPDPIQSNLSISRHWPDEQRFFFDVVMASKDAWGAAFCCGTSSVIRFEALQASGGFPTDSVTEDYLLSVRLRQKGLQTVYLNERLSLGLAPEGLKEYVVQRSRWCLGFVQICRGASGPLWPGNSLSPMDRIVLSETFLFWSATHAYRLLGLVVPPLYLLFGITAVEAPLADALGYFVPYFAVHMATMRWLTGGRVLPGMADISQMLAAHEILRAVWAGLTRPQGQKFKVTAKGGDRSQRVVQWPLLRLFLAYLALNLAGILVAFVFDSNRNLLESSALALVWSWYNIAILVTACLVCIEQPRLRQSERLEATDPVDVTVGGRTTRHTLADVSLGGMRIEGAAPAGRGETVRIVWNGLAVDGTVVRAGERDFAVVFPDDASTPEALFVAVFSGRYGSSVEQISGRAVAGGILARVFR